MAALLGVRFTVDEVIAHLTSFALAALERRMWYRATRVFYVGSIRAYFFARHPPRRHFRH